jgi:hypothetical protein
LYGFVKHRANPKFWGCYHRLSSEIQKLGVQNFALLKQDERHPSLHYKKVGRFWSVRVGMHFRALAVQRGDDMVWFWIGRHDEYDSIIGGRQI